MIIVGVFNIFQIIMMLPIKGALPEQDLNFLMTLLAICQVVYSAINCFLIFKCYAMICPEGQEDMPRKKSKFEFVNKIREKKDAKEEKAIEDMKNYYEEKLRATMTDEWEELFAKYTDCVHDFQTITDCLIFQNGFKLGARMMLEVMEE